MDPFLESIEKLKKHVELTKQTCPCWNAPAATPPRSLKNPESSAGAALANGNLPSPSYAPACEMDFEEDGNGDWISAFKAEAGPWTGGPLVVLSLFDGIGGIWQALTNLGIPFIGYSSEVLAPAKQVVQARHSKVKQLGDVKKLRLSAIGEKVDLVVGGFPWIMGKKEGLQGSTRKYFFDLLRVLQMFRPKWFLVENVASMSLIDRDEISRHLKVNPLELDSQEISACKSRRLYWTNIPHPPRLPQLRDHPSTSLQSCLDKAIALEQKCGVVLCSNSYRVSTAGLDLVLEEKTKLLRHLTITEFERLMGYPEDYTNVVTRDVNTTTPKETEREKEQEQEQVVETPVKTKVPESESSLEPPSTRLLRKNRVSWTFSEPRDRDKNKRQATRQDSVESNDRWCLLGNTFSVQVIAYLTSPLLKSAVRSQGRPVTISGTVKERELSAMEPGDVWALFNENRRPNWYALIKSRTGGRFSPIPNDGNKRNVTMPPLKIEMQYLEMTSNYLEGEVDEWNPQQGSGLFKLRPFIDLQESWLAFSHRVTSVIKFDHSYFVYPGNDEVWAVYHARTWSRYFVYVVGSTISCEKLEKDKPGDEGFYASCLLLRRTSEHETYVKTSTELVFTDIKAFCFRVPFRLKNEANLLKMETSGVMSRESMGADREATPGYFDKKRKKGKTSRRDSGSDEDEDDDPIVTFDDGITPEEIMGWE